MLVERPSYLLGFTNDDMEMVYQKLLLDKYQLRDAVFTGVRVLIDFILVFKVMSSWIEQIWLHAIWIIIFLVFQFCSYLFNKHLLKQSLSRMHAHTVLKYSISIAIIIISGPAWLNVIGPLEQEPLLHLVILVPFFSKTVTLRPFLAINVAAVIGWVVSQMIVSYKQYSTQILFFVLYALFSALANLMLVVMLYDRSME
jgi:hypothetical protein